MVRDRNLCSCNRPRSGRETHSGSFAVWISLISLHTICTVLYFLETSIIRRLNASPAMPSVLHCAYCVESMGSPRGQLFASSSAKNAHLARLRLEKEQIVSQEDIESQATCVFLSTVIDEGPDTYHSLDHNDVDFTSTIPVPDILGCVNRLGLTVKAQHNQPSEQPTYSDSSTQPPPQPLPSLSNQPCQKKNKPNCHVTRNLQLLTSIQACISATDARLSTPTHDHLCEIESEVAELQIALSKIKHCSDAVTSCKQDIVKALETLNDRVTELRITIADTRSGPVKYNSRKFNFLHLYRHLKSTTGVITPN
jgi:hypothetical protein